MTRQIQTVSGNAPPGYRVRLRRVAPFREADVTRAARGAAKAGLRVTGIKISPSGEIEVLTETSVSAPIDVLDEWKAKRDARRPQGN